MGVRYTAVSVVVSLQAICWAAAAGVGDSLDPEQGWVRHTIDRSSRGADGVRLADANGDGRPDIVTGWEEGGVVRLYLHPGPQKVREPWPSVTVADQVASVEDAVMVDLDNDGGLDVVISCEGDLQTLFVAWAPSDRSRLLDPAAWQVEAFPATRGATRWMFALPLQIDGVRGVDLVAASKNPNGRIGWFECPANPRDLAGWTWHPLRKAGWVMSLIASDMDGDGDCDVVCSDRKGAGRGCFWLENPGPGPEQTKPWREHAMGAQGREVMFMNLADVDGDGLEDGLAAVKKSEMLLMHRRSTDGRRWEREPILFPGNAGIAKAVAAADLNRTGALTFVVSCGSADGQKVGVFSLRRDGDRWAAQSISGAEGVKFDLVVLEDLDSDGDLDVLTCEERANLGVFWYENPGRR